MRPAPREPSKQLNTKSLPATKRRAASGLGLSAQAEPAANKTKTTIANRVTMPTPLQLGPLQVGRLIKTTRFGMHVVHRAHDKIPSSVRPPFSGSQPQSYPR